MLTTANINELNLILSSSNANPHNILGMHEVNVKGKTVLSVRAYIPDANKIICIDKKNKKKRYELSKVHLDGFFEATISDRNDFFDYILEVENFDGSTYEKSDPYCFLPQISDMDCYLFGQGTHYKIYEKLGAHIKEVNGVSGVLFAVWAPSAKRVSVIGNFNNWDGRVHQMRSIGSSGIFEIFIPGLLENTHYKFEIKTQDNTLLEKSDPYANFNELRPSHSSLVTNLDNYKWKDKKWINDRSKNDAINKPINVYEVHLGSWKKSDEEGREFLSFLELRQTLIPYVKEMGYTHIELMPIMEHPFDGSWGYQVTGYYAVTSRFGSPTEFMEFIDCAHQNGIGVILDWVPAHFPKDAHGLAVFDGTNLYEHSDKRQGEHPEWGTLIFNYGRNEVKNFLIANSLFWLEKFHVDGIRVDAVASMLYLDYGKNDGQWVPNMYGGRENLEAVEFLKHMNSIISKEYPDAIICAEESTSWPQVSRPVSENGLGFNLKWNMGWMNDYLVYIQKDPVHRKYHHGQLTFGMVYAYTENFILVLSHDEVVHGKKSLIDKMPGDIWQKCANLRLTFGFMYGHPGKVLNFMGQEFGQFSEWSEKRSLDWFLLEYDHHKKIQNYVKDLNHLYKEEKAFWHDDFTPKGFQWIVCDDYNNSILSFKRMSDDEKDTLIFICNFTPSTYEEYEIVLDKEGSYKEISNSDSEKYGGSDFVNSDILTTVKNGDNYVLNIKVSPLATIILKRV